MLDKYEKEQTRAVTMLKNQIMSNAIAHSYIFVVPENENKMPFIKDFIKEMIDADDNVAAKIDKEILIDLKVIRPDGMQIKKGQILDLQADFMNKAIEINKKIYIIEEVDKLNPSAGNTLLKFLEEPEANIIALLTTNNIEAVLSTIKSRCSIVYLAPTETEENIDTAISEAAIKFLNKYEMNGNNIEVFLDELIFSIVKEKKEMEKFLQTIVYLYNEILRHKIKKELFADEKRNQIIEKNTIKKLITKIRIFILIKNKVKYNINLKLLMDKMIFLLKEAENE